MTTTHDTSIATPAAAVPAELAESPTPGVDPTGDVFTHALSVLDAAGIGFEIVEDLRLGRAA
jgi:hypothetical protein